MSISFASSPVTVHVLVCFGRSYSGGTGMSGCLGGARLSIGATSPRPWPGCGGHGPYLTGLGCGPINFGPDNKAPVYKDGVGVKITTIEVATLWLTES